MRKKENKINTNEIAVFVGRFCPIHSGHEWIVRHMIQEFGLENCLLVIGSVNNPLSLRNFFSYRERRNFILKLFPRMKIVGLADFFNIKDWLLALDDLLRAIFSHCKKDDFVFFGGSKREIDYFINNGYQSRIFNRFSRNGKNISATEIRNRLVVNKSLTGLVNPLIIEDIQRAFRKKWKIFKSR